MRILLLVHSLDGGGAERVAANMTRYWAVDGHEVCLVTIAGAERKSYEISERVHLVHLDLDRPSHSALSKLWQIIRRVGAIRRELRRFKPDVALGFMSSSAVLLALGAVGVPCLTVGCERHYPPRLPLGRAWTLARRYAYGLLDSVAVQTDAGAKWLRSNTAARRITVIPNALPWPMLDQQPAVAPESILPPGRSIVLAAGRLSPAKGFDDLIRAFADIAPRWSEWDLVILGEGLKRDELKELAHSAGVSDRVYLPGRVGNIREWFARASIFALSSKDEGFPNVLLEAMGSGIAVVATDCETGPSELIKTEETGLLVPVENPVALALALERLVSDADLRSKFAEAGQAVRHRFGEPAIMQAWYEEFRVLARVRTSGSRLKPVVVSAAPQARVE